MEPSNVPSIVQLSAHYNNYNWGKIGSASLVAEMFRDGHEDFNINPREPYSELWMGTHPDGPARVKGSSCTLSSYIAQSQSEHRLESNNNLKKESHLPFIMKIMSIAKPLSLQVHPTKEQAERLHKINPKNYPDRNHKPELAYAITRFELLCGFRPAHEMYSNLKAFPALQKLFGEDHRVLLRQLELAKDNKNMARSEAAKKALEDCFRHMIYASPEKVSVLIKELMTDLANGVRGCISDDTLRQIRIMFDEFPGDVGVFSPLYLNHMILQPGECCYYASQELHAYLSGECVECVGNSNNTIRAAMTPKYIDKETLCEVLNYHMTEQADYLVPPQTLSEYKAVQHYSPDCLDFQLHRVQVPKNQDLPRGMQLPSLDCGSIMIMYRGSAILEDEPSASNTPLYNDLTNNRVQFEAKRGDIFYIRPGRRIRFTKHSKDLEAFRTFSFETGPDHENLNFKYQRSLNGIDIVERAACRNEESMEETELSSGSELDSYESGIDIDNDILPGKKGRQTVDFDLGPLEMDGLY